MTTPKHFSSLSRKILIYNIAILILVIGLCLISYKYWYLRIHPKLRTPPLSELRPDSNGVPYYKEIMDIIRPLEYSVIPSLILQPDIKLNIDFKNKIWTLRNFHQYDANGNIILEYNRYGLCGELASFAYHRIKPLLSNRYTIKFANVAESGFFLVPSSSHSILIIFDTLQSKAYLLDPALHRYGPVENFNDYLISSIGETIAGIDRKAVDVSFSVNHGEPMTIRNDFISMLSVEDCNGKFDKDNFVLAIRANRRYEYTGRYILALRKNAGNTQIFEDSWFENKALPPEDISLLKQTLSAWFNALGK